MISEERIVTGDVEVQTRQVLGNLKSVLEAAGTDLDHALKMTVYIVDKQRNFDMMNQAYRQYIRSNPARTTIDVSFIKETPEKALVEMDAIAYIEGE